MIALYGNSNTSYEHKLEHTAAARIIGILIIYGVITWSCGADWPRRFFSSRINYSTSSVLLLLGVLAGVGAPGGGWRILSTSTTAVVCFCFTIIQAIIEKQQLIRVVDDIIAGSILSLETGCCDNEVVVVFIVQQ